MKEYVGPGSQKKRGKGVVQPAKQPHTDIFFFYRFRGKTGLPFISFLLPFSSLFPPFFMLVFSLSPLFFPPPPLQPYRNRKPPYLTQFSPEEKCGKRKGGNFRAPKKNIKIKRKRVGVFFLGPGLVWASLQKKTRNEGTCVWVVCVCVCGANFHEEGRAKKKKRTC